MAFQGCRIGRDAGVLVISVAVVGGQQVYRIASRGNIPGLGQVKNVEFNPTTGQAKNFALNGGLDDLISGGIRRSADDVNATFPDGYSPPYTPGTQVKEFVSDGNQTFVRVVSGDSPGGQWVMKASDIQGLSPQQIADKYALPEVPTAITSITPPAGTRIRTGEVNPNFGGAGGGAQFQLLDRVNDGWADVTPLQ